MTQSGADVVVAGHICLDIIPEIGGAGGGLEGLLTPGSLLEVGPAVTSTGGAVSNTGLALHRLGVKTRLMGKIGDDIFGRAVVDRLHAQDEELARGMIVAEGASTSYTLVISPPNVDRVFLHSPGVNNAYGASDIPIERVCDAQLFHFGYPPIMREIYADGGRGLEQLFSTLHDEGIATSLDMSQPDPNSEAGRIDWQAWMALVLPHVEIFAPSFEEILFMLDRPRFDEMTAAADGTSIVNRADGALLEAMADEILEMGVAVLALKLGDQGLYLRTSGERERFSILEHHLSVAASSWLDRELFAPCFKTNVVGTTGAGDATVAGLLAGLVHGQGPEAVVTSAVGVGAFSVEAPDATSGLTDWETIQLRIRQGWDQLPHTMLPPTAHS